MSLVLDTGVVLALLDAADPDHGRCVDAVDEVAEDLVVPTPILAEVDYWCRKLLGVETFETFVADLSQGAYRIHVPDVALLERAAALERQYADLDLGYVDAAVIATCETLGETKVATLDRRHFTIVRPSHVLALTLVPS